MIDPHVDVVAKLLPEAVAQLRRGGGSLDDAVLVVGDLGDERFGFPFAVMSWRLDRDLSDTEARKQVQASIDEGRTHVGRMLPREIAFALLAGNARGDRSNVPLLRDWLAQPVPEGHVRVLIVVKGRVLHGTFKAPVPN